jgi:hypothetical protein
MRYEEQIAVLDELLAGLKDEPEDSGAHVLKEHLESARICLLGAMPLEYELDLDLADAAASVPGALPEGRDEMVKRKLAQLHMGSSRRPSASVL